MVDVVKENLKLLLSILGTPTEGQFCCWDEATNSWILGDPPSGGSDVKSGTISSVDDNATASVTFGTVFTGTPKVACCQSSGTKEHTFITSSVSTTGFTVKVVKTHSGGGDSIDVDWIATDAGDT